MKFERTLDEYKKILEVSVIKEVAEASNTQSSISNFFRSLVQGVRGGRPVVTPKFDSKNLYVIINPKENLQKLDKDLNVDKLENDLLNQINSIMSRDIQIGDQVVAKSGSLGIVKSINGPTAKVQFNNKTNQVTPIALNVLTKRINKINNVDAALNSNYIPTVNQQGQINLIKLKLLIYNTFVAAFKSNTNEFSIYEIQSGKILGNHNPQMPIKSDNIRDIKIIHNNIIKIFNQIDGGYLYYMTPEQYQVSQKEGFGKQLLKGIDTGVPEFTKNFINNAIDASNKTTVTM